MPNHDKFSAHCTSSRWPFSLFAGLYLHRLLIYRLTAREISSRYRGSILGAVWLFLVPLCQLAIYTLIFSRVFKARWDVELNSSFDFALVLFLGLIVFNLFGEVLARSPTLLLENVSYIKKVVFPLEVLPVVAVLGALVNAFISLVMLVIFYLFVKGTLSWGMLIVPIYFVPCAFFGWGVALIFSSLGVFLRDLKPIIALLTMVLLFLSPIFYPLSAVPEGMRAFLVLSPITQLIDDARAVLFKGSSPDFIMLTKQFLISWLFVWISYLWFMKTKKGFADVV